MISDLPPKELLDEVKPNLELTLTADEGIEQLKPVMDELPHHTIHIDTSAMDFCCTGQLFNFN